MSVGVVWARRPTSAQIGSVGESTVPRDIYSGSVAQQVGILVRHVKACATHSGRLCNCRPSYKASVPTFAAADLQLAQLSEPSS